MSVVDVVFMVLKGLLVGAGFSMNLAVILTWADRRYGAMLQDRVGPDRAVIWLPRPIAQGAAFLPALGVGLAMIAFAFVSKDDAASKTGNAMLLVQAGIFAAWTTGLVISGAVKRRKARSKFDLFMRDLGDPRRFFYGGIIAHVATIVAAGILRGSPLGRELRDAAYSAGPMLFAFATIGGALYACLQMKEDKIGLRLVGLLHPAADGLKTIFKEDFIPPKADRLLHGIAPVISFFPALVVLGTVPFGDSLCFDPAAEDVKLFGVTIIKQGGLHPLQLVSSLGEGGVCAGRSLTLQVASLNVGILYFFALAGTGIVGAALAGWSSDNKFSLLGGLRAASQMVSYEVTLGLTIVGTLMIYGTLRVEEMVRWQAENTWGIFVQPVAFVLFMAAAVAESKRIPFDLPEGESEIVAGYFTEYAGMKFAMFFFSEYIAVVTSGALMAAVFFGGWALPFVAKDGIHIAIGDTVLLHQQLSHGAIVLIGFVGFIVKTIMLCMIQLTIRWTLPRFRYDQLMMLGWRKLLPASLVNILLTGVVVLAVQSAGPKVTSALAVACDLTEAFVAAAGIAAVFVSVRFLLLPAEHRRVISSSSAKFAAMMGGTRAAKMGA